MNGHRIHKIAETDKYIFYNRKIYSKSQWRILIPQISSTSTGKKYDFKKPFTQLTPKYKMEYPINLEQIKEFTEKHNLKFWI